MDFVVRNYSTEPHSSTANAAPARVLVADDDPASCRFLCDGLRALGAEVEICMDGSSALRRARTTMFDLLLLDCRMPGAGALRILGELRHDAAAGSAESLAVATTADLAPGDRPLLLAAGFSDILLKPCGLADLRRMLGLVMPDDQPIMPVLDDSAALISSGSAATMHALRGLLRDELWQLVQELDALCDDRPGLAERLHRLRSSCGFCGATALALQAAALERHLTGPGAAPLRLTRFRTTLLTTLQALDS